MIYLPDLFPDWLEERCWLDTKFRIGGAPPPGNPLVTLLRFLDRIGAIQRRELGEVIWSSFLRRPCFHRRPPWREEGPIGVIHVGALEEM